MTNTLVNKEGIPTLIVQDHSAINIKNYALIDVRRPDEFVGGLGHIKDAKLITLGPDLDAFLKSENKNLKILFICRSGARSGKATEQALSMGFKDVFNMDGGMIYWNEKKFPITKEKSMKKNIGSAERIIRVVGGVALTVMAFVGPENKLFLLGLIPLVTGLIGWCPLYKLCGLNTCRASINQKKDGSSN